MILLKHQLNRAVHNTRSFEKQKLLRFLLFQKYTKKMVLFYVRAIENSESSMNRLEPLARSGDCSDELFCHAVVEELVRMEQYIKENLVTRFVLRPVFSGCIAGRCAAHQPQTHGVPAVRRK